ncbi:hypothetical protein JW930_07130 [Candidatus Woesearchaeota archaeon]|nr:hypothetical protein [Candidatus Woesearchaeota archaeon]
MVLLKLFGIIDLLAVILFVLSAFFGVKHILLYVVAAYLIIKGTLFTVMSRDIASMIDIICGFYALTITLGVKNNIVNGIIVLYLAQKVFFSLK